MLPRFSHFEIRTQRKHGNLRQLESRIGGQQSRLQPVFGIISLKNGGARPLDHGLSCLNQAPGSNVWWIAHPNEAIEAYDGAIGISFDIPLASDTRV